MWRTSSGSTRTPRILTCLSCGPCNRGGHLDSYGPGRRWRTPCRAGTECLQCRKFAEALAGHVFVIVVACGKAGPGNKNLSLFPAWQGASVFIHDGDKGVRNGLADGDRVAQATGSGSFMPGRVRRHFCRAVEVPGGALPELGRVCFPPASVKGTRRCRTKG